MRRILSEPLLHFLLLGMALFVLYQAVSPGGGSERAIVVNDATIAMLSQRYAAIWLRTPTPEELQVLVDNYIREEILYREGVAMGLDRNDPVIQRRVVQKLDVLSEESSSLTPPGEAELASYLRKNAGRYVRPAVFDYHQVMFDPSRHGASLEADFNAALAELNAGADPAAMGDASLLPAKAEAVPLDRVELEFGQEFAAAIQALPVGSWQGPVRSGFGVHIVRIDRKIEAQATSLTEVRAAVERDWEYERRETAREAFYQDALRNYDIRIEAGIPRAAPESVNAGPTAAEQAGQ
ncbi:MAG TPA: peptidylprolyl isomerase [Xanthomonadales bacterium]|nr:peptidylprolyl isomerase [Xanthomonadales bacterium]